MQPKPRKWNIPDNKLEEVKKLLITNCGIEDSSISETSKEVWRIRINKAVFTQYSTGTLFSNPTNDEYVLAVRNKISDLIGSGFQTTKSEFLIGLDETGKGEFIGHSVLVGVAFPASLKEEIENLISVTDTKKKREAQYWDQLYLEIDHLKLKGLSFIIEKILPRHTDRFNINKIMDLVYQRMISHLLRRVPEGNCSIVLDDYGVGRNISLFLDTLQKRGATIRVQSKADDRYLETKLASIIAKGEREKIIQAIGRRVAFEDCPVGSGNAGDPLTIKWLTRWKKTGKPWPWFVKQSFANVRELDGNTGKIEKQDPPIRNELISSDSQNLFREGKLSVTTLSILCPSCGNIAKSARVTSNIVGFMEGRCISCNEIIRDLNTTLLYYNGHLLPDSNVILSDTISKDLDKGAFFENFTFLLHPEVTKECDNQGGKAELERIADDASIGRIGLAYLKESVNESRTNDEQLVDIAQKYNAIVLTGDQGLHVIASGKGTFVLYVEV